MLKTLRRFLFPFTAIATLFVMLSGLVLAASWTFKFPLQVTDTSATDRTYIPVLTGVTGTSLTGYMNATGTDTNMQISGTNIKYMMSTTQTAAVIPSLNSNAKTTLDLYTGYDPVQTAFPIITGDQGYYWTADAAAIEPGNNFEFDMSGYIDTTSYYGNKKLIYKPEAWVVRQSSAGNLTAGIISAETYQITTTNDAAWHSIDISNYVAPDATGVILEVVSANGTPYNSAFRKTGSTDDRYKLCTHIWAAVGLDSTQSFDYRLADNNLDVYLRGYTEGSSYWVFNTNAVDKSMVAIAAWTDIDVSANVPVGTDGVIIEVIETGTGTATSGLRMNGSGDNRTSSIVLNHHYWAIVGVDSNRIFEGWIGNASVDFFLVGYIIDGTTFNLNATDISLAGAAAWTDMDLSASAPNARFAVVETTMNLLASDYGFRRNGITGAGDSLYQEMDSAHCWSVVELDHNQIVEGEIANIAPNPVNFYLVGYVTSGVRHCDTVTYTYSQSVSGAVTSADQRIDVRESGGLSFDGAADWVNTNGANVNAATTAFTVAMWVNITPTGAGECLWSRALDGIRLYVRDTGAFQVILFDTAGVTMIDRTTTDVGYDDGNWHLITLTYSNPTVSLYIDTVSALNFPSDITAGNGTVRASPSSSFGRREEIAGLYFTGLMDEVAYWNVAESQAQVTAYYNGTINTTGLQGWWKLDDGAGNATDSSGNGYTGTVNGATWAIGRLVLYANNLLKAQATGLAVTGNDCEWLAMQGNIMPYVDYDIRDAPIATELIKYQPAQMLTATTIPDLTGAAQNGTIVWGSNASLSITPQGIVGYQSTQSTAGGSTEVGFDVPAATMPTNWFGGGTITDKPFYGMMTDIYTQTGIPQRTLYMFIIFGVAMTLGVGIFMVFKGLLLPWIAALVILWAGVSMSVVPAWMVFVYIILGIGIIYGRRQL